MKKQHYMTEHERYKLEAFLQAKKPISWIAKEMGFCERTIYYEKKRGLTSQIRNPHGIPIDTIEYSAQKGQQIHRYNQTAKGRPLKIGNDYKYAEYLENKIIKERYSPAAALAAARKNGFTTNVCITTLYSYIEKQIFLKLNNKHLWVKSSRKQRTKAPERRIAHPKLPSITDRPYYINDRSEVGHWEMDLVVGKKGSSPVLLTLTERVTRQELIFKLPDKKAATVCSLFDQLEKKMPKFKEKFRSITTDNGSEFLVLEKLQKSIHGGKRFDVWYCHSYAAWEKGSNENHNRMIRRWFPKGTDFSKITKKQVAAVQNWMNNYPRRILNWNTPNEMTA